VSFSLKLAMSISRSLRNEFLISHIKQQPG
jgi:hypothetical protein